MPDSIVKLVYKREFFDFTLMRFGAKQIITITNDGVIVEKAYAPGRRKAHMVVKVECSTQAFHDLCVRLVDCIETADSLDGYCDDSSEELTIYHKFGRIQTMDRGLGNEAVRIGDVMNSFLANYLSD